MFRRRQTQSLSRLLVGVEVNIFFQCAQTFVRLKSFEMICVKTSGCASEQRQAVHGARVFAEP